MLHCKCTEINIYHEYNFEQDVTHIFIIPAKILFCSKKLLKNFSP